MAHLPTAAMQLTSAPTEPTVADSPHIKNHKTGFLDLPQELRDQIYSLIFYIPLKHHGVRVPLHHAAPPRPTMQIAAVCRTFRHDILAAFWSQRSVLINSRSLADQSSWSEDYLPHIKDLEVLVVDCFAVDGFWQTAYFNIFKEGGEFRVVLAPYQEPRGQWRLSYHMYTSDECEAIREAMQEKARPFVEKAKRILNEEGCITPAAVQILAGVHESISY